MLIDIRDTHPITEFNKKTTEYVGRLKQTRKPEVLTINGTASIVVQDAGAYQEMVEKLDLLESVERIKQAIKAFDAGEGIPIEDAFRRLQERLAAKYPSAEV